MVVARVRVTGEIQVLEVAGSLTGGARCPKNVALQELSRAASKEASEFRETYSDIQFFVENQLVQTYEFPDAKHKELRRKKRELAAAQAELDRAAAASLVAEEAASGLAAAKEAEETAAQKVKELEAAIGSIGSDGTPSESTAGKGAKEKEKKGKS